MTDNSNSKWSNQDWFPFIIVVGTGVVTLAYLIYSILREQYDNEYEERDDQGCDLTAWPRSTRLSVTSVDTTSSRGQWCPICLLDMSVDRPGNIKRIRECGHEFHTICIKAWMRRHNTCPVCRQEVPKFI